jgi:membrane protein involved in D-alanine export
MFGLMGLWHGTTLNYLLYGMYHAVLFSAYEYFQRWNKTRKVWGEGLFWNALGVFGTFNLVCFGFLIFSGRIIS